MCCHFVYIPVFYEVWRRAREHSKLRHFSTAKKTQENPVFLYELSVMLYFRRAFYMFFRDYVNGKTNDFEPRENACKLH